MSLCSFHLKHPSLSHLEMHYKLPLWGWTPQRIAEHPSADAQLEGAFFGTLIWSASTEHTLGRISDHPSKLVETHLIEHSVNTFQNSPCSALRQHLPKSTKPSALLAHAKM